MSNDPEPPAGPNPFSDQPQKPPVIGDANPYASPGFVTDAPGYAWATTPSLGLQRVGTGLGFVYYGIVVILFGFLIALLGPLLLRSPQVALVGILGLLAGRVLMIIGPFFCLAVPQQTGAKPLIVSSVVFMMLNVTETIISLVGQLGGDPLPLPMEVTILSAICGLVATILFLLFLRRLSMYIGRPDLAQRAISVLVLNIIIIVLPLILLAVVLFGSAGDMSQLRQSSGPLVGVLALTLLVLAIIWLVMYTNLLVALRKVLKRS